MTTNFDPMHQWATDLFPICRSITGEGVRETFTYLKNLMPDLKIHSVPTGTRVMDWKVPEEWNIQEAYIEDLNGNKIIDFNDNNLHVVSYSEAVDKVMPFTELKDHLYTLPDMPEAIPYVTSYYKRRWGFCLTHNQLENLKDDSYHVVIKSSHTNGALNYGELVIPGETEEEIFFSTYVCHPSMANNELSGPILATAIARWVSQLKNKKYTYRFVFAPETIGAITYISKNIENLKSNVVAAFNLTCVGDDGEFSFMPSRLGETLADRVALNILKKEAPNYNHFKFLDRGSDERQYCSPGVDLPMITIMRTRYGDFPEYHTSLDNLDFISQQNLEESLVMHQKCISLLENNNTWKTVSPCEPHLSKHNLYPDINKHQVDYSEQVNILNFLAYADGNHDIIAIADRIKLDIETCLDLAEKLSKVSLIEKI